MAIRTSTISIFLVLVSVSQHLEITVYAGNFHSLLAYIQNSPYKIPSHAKSRRIHYFKGMNPLSRSCRLYSKQVLHKTNSKRSLSVGASNLVDRSNLFQFITPRSIITNTHHNSRSFASHPLLLEKMDDHDFDDRAEIIDNEGDKKSIDNYDLESAKHQTVESEAAGSLSSITERLLQSTINRAARTMTDISDSTSSFSSTEMDGVTIDSDEPNQNVQDLLTKVINRSSNTLGMSKEGTTRPMQKNHDNDLKVKKDDPNNASVEVTAIHKNENYRLKQEKKHQDKRQYLSNPSVTPTALAHSLWSEVVRPYEDTIIDATCGNGKDTLVLAKLLFPQEDQNDDVTTGSTKFRNQPKSATKKITARLVGVDIQKQACENTIQLLDINLPSNIIDNHVQIIHSSHAPLPKMVTSNNDSMAQSTAGVGLVCYNLGYLPGSGSSNKHVSTTMVTTIYSLADASEILRVGGLLSVMTYPGSSYMEYCAVKYYMEGLAMFSSREDWRDFVACIPDDDHLISQIKSKENLSFDPQQNEENDFSSSSEKKQATVREVVRIALERVMTEGDVEQTWRVFEHRPLGRPMSPILFTAMKIK